MGFDSWDMYNVGERSLYPGPIDNSGLFSGIETCLITLSNLQLAYRLKAFNNCCFFPIDQETQALKDHLIDELDYVLVPTEAWNKLVSWYSCLEAQKPIVRKVTILQMFFICTIHPWNEHLNVLLFFRLLNMACLSSTVRWKCICWS